MISVDVLVEADGWSRLPDAGELIARALAAAAGAAGVALREGAEVSVLLADDRAVRALNRDWRGQDRPTNVLSFPAARGPLADAPMLGDIALAFETVAREAEDEGKPLADHVAHLAVHGFLHLIGHDHETGADAEVMEALERAILAGLGVPDPYGPDLHGSVQPAT
jgi:probable rRNA maturation factor